MFAPDDPLVTVDDCELLQDLEDCFLQFAGVILQCVVLDVLPLLQDVNRVEPSLEHLALSHQIHSFEDAQLESPVGLLLMDLELQLVEYQGHAVPSDVVRASLSQEFFAYLPLGAMTQLSEDLSLKTFLVDSVAQL